MITLAGSNKLKLSLGVYQSICESIFEQFNLINMQIGEKKVTFCLNIHINGKYAAFPSTELVFSQDKWAPFLGEDADDLVDNIFKDGFVNQKLLDDHGV